MLSKIVIPRKIGFSIGNNAKKSNLKGKSTAEINIILALSQKWITFTQKADGKTTKIDPKVTKIPHQAVADESIHNSREVDSTFQ